MTTGMTRVRTYARGLALLAALLLAGCDTVSGWVGAGEAPPLPGTRVSVLTLEKELVPDPGIADITVQVPDAWRNVSWPQAAGFPNHAMHNLELPKQLAVTWQSDVGEGTTSSNVLSAQPVVADGTIYTLDSESTVSAINVADGRQRWRVDLTPEEEESGALGGGLAYADGVLYAATGYGEIIALETAGGTRLWTQHLGTPFRVAPTVVDGRIFAISYDNQMVALATTDGRVLWNHAGIAEDAGLLGGASPAVEGGIVVAPYSSGELFGLRVENGRVVWQDQLIRAARYTPLANLSEIRGSPVIDRGLVFAISHAGRMVAVDLRTGDRIWERDLAGVETPWVAGEFIYLVTVDAELLCLSRRDGRIRWVAQLKRFEDEQARSGPIEWTGPVLAGGRLILLSSDGKAVSVSPSNGEILGSFDLPDGASVPPLVVDGTLFVLTDNAELVAYR
jgi:outer membrane protein assembly factor BamB